jgi:phosphoribosylformylglycinamidine synthase subunit PurL
MGSRAGTGLEIDLQFVPQRETGMSPYEIMLSESQERMLLVAEKGREEEVIQVFRKWEIDAVTIGHVTDDGILRVKHFGQVVAEIPNLSLTDEAPVYHRPLKQPEQPAETSPVHLKFPQSEKDHADLDYGKILQRFLTSCNLASREWVYQQYDHMVRTNTAQLPGGDAAVIRIKGTQKALAMCLDGNGRYCKNDPRRGAQIAVAESCRNLVCAGAQPMAATNCLNFGNPQKPEIMWQFSEVIDGMAEACSTFETPVTGGNVSFYNETLGEGIYPTPVIGMVGLIEPIANIRGSWLINDGDTIVLLGPLIDPDCSYSKAAKETMRACARKIPTGDDLYSAWASLIPCPPINLEQERQVQKTCLEGIRAGVILSAHDCSDGGLAVALAEMCFSHFTCPAKGASIEIPGHHVLENVLFGEYQSRILVTLKDRDIPMLEKIAKVNSIILTKLGRVEGNRLRISANNKVVIDQEVQAIEKNWRTSLGRHFERSL